MKLQTFIYAILIGLCYPSCSDDSPETPEKEKADGTVSFSIDVTAFATRVTQDGTSWRKGDCIGTYMIDADTSQPLEHSANVSYSCSEDGQLVSFTSGLPLLLPQDGKRVNFIAYYPYDSNVNNQTIAVKLTEQQTGSTSYDLMYGASRQNYTYSEESNIQVPLTFEHSLSKVILKFTNEEGNPQSVGSLSIRGMKTEAAFNLKTGILAMEQNSEADIIPYVNAVDGSFEAIVLPSVITGDYIVSFMVADKQCEWKFTNVDTDLPAFQKGYRYVFTIPVKENGETGTAKMEQLSGSSTSPWNDGDIIEGGAPEVLPTFNLFPEGTDAYADTELKIVFQGMLPTLGTEGYIRIYRADDNAKVDEINMAERRYIYNDNNPQQQVLDTWTDIIGMTPKDAKVNSKRAVGYEAVKIEGNTIFIKPHSQRLKPSTKYYVTIDKTAINQRGFQGIYAGRWQFTTRDMPVVTPGATSYAVKVSHTDTNADFYTLQGAIDYFAANVDRHIPKIINMDDGVYREMIYLRDQDNITIKGISGNPDKVNIQYNNHNGYNGGVGNGMNIDYDAPLGTPIFNGNRSVVTLGGDADKIRFENLTIENWHGWTNNQKGQAEAIILGVSDKSALAFVNCKFLSFQDTILTGGGYSWFSNCLIAGTTDFLWGGGNVVLFEDCEIRAVWGGRVMQARLLESSTGYVFSRCNFTMADPNCRSASLIYSYKPDNLIFLNSTLADPFVNFFNERGIVLQPAVPTLSVGCKMYNVTNTAKKDFFTLVPEEKGTGSIYQLSHDEYEQCFGSRSVIMNRYDNDGGKWFN